MSHAYNNATGTVYPPTFQYAPNSTFPIPTGAPAASSKDTRDGEVFQEKGAELQAVGLIYVQE